MKDALYWSVLVIISAIAGSGLYYQYQNTRPCTHPISYSIGAVDTRFGIGNIMVLTEAKAAATIWNKAAGKTVLVYDPKASMKINFVYDEREANAKFGVQIAQRQAEEDTARATLDAAQAQYLTAQTAYNQKVKASNASGGATSSEAAALDAERASLNALADSINGKVVAFNASIAALNAVVNEYNKTAGHTFEEGNYVRDSSGERINIFEFVGNIQLERVLTHEFGHAIGLDHNADPKSIMFSRNESGNLVPTASDLFSLRAVCGA